MNPFHPGETVSIWHDTHTMPNFSPLKQDLDTDVCVVGGGIGGLMTAYLLMKEGKKVCVLESFELASGQTGRTTAHVSNALDDRFFEIEKYHGRNGAYLAAESHGAAMDLIEEIANTEEIDCDLERIPGYLFATDEEQFETLRKELKAIERASCFKDAEILRESPLPSLFSTGCIKFPRQLQFHPTKFLSGLSRCLIKGGAKIFTHTHVTDIQSGEAAAVLTKSGHRVLCRSVVVATNTPINDIFAIHTKQAPYRTYAIGVQIPKGCIPKGLYWDTLDPYHYIRVDSHDAHDLLIVGGEDHKTGQKDNPEECFERLETWTRKKFIEAYKVTHKWSGQVMEPVDALGYLGHNPLDRNNVYVITGDSGNGLTHCAVGAMIISDQIMNRENPWEKLYSPSRISVRAGSEFLKENLNVAAQYADWIQPKPKSNLKDLLPGQGIVFREGISMVAAYKDESGSVDLMSAVCPHLAGVVRWNSVEKTWDCPCHGSRFDCQGTVIEGPATTDLKKMDAEHGNKNLKGSKSKVTSSPSRLSKF